MIKNITFYASVIALTSLITTLPASAATVAATDGFPGNNNIGIAPGVDTGDMSFSFTTDASDYVFNSVTLVLGFPIGGGTPGLFSVTLNADNSGTPGAILESLTGSNDPSTAETQYTYSGTSLLSANTTYWITLSDPGDNFYDFYTANTTDESPGSMWSIGDDVYSSTWGFQNASGPYTSQFDADVSPVPVPAAIWLFGSGLLGIYFKARKTS